MNLHQAKIAIQEYMNARIPVFIWGAPGVGKSDAVRQIGAALGRKVIDFRAILLDPVDLRGIPHIEAGRTVWAAPDFFPRVDRDGEFGVLLIDEMNTAPQSTQAALYQLILDRRLGEYELPDNWDIIAAGNRQSDRAAAISMPSALANRFAHVDVEPEIDTWLTWAYSAGLNPVVPAFLAWKPDALFSMTNDRRAFPSPRSWERVARIAHHTGDMLSSLAYGLVGDGAGTEFCAFATVWNSLPSVKSILADPTGSPVPSEPSARFAVAMALARAADFGTFAAACEYMRRLPPEYMACGLRHAVEAKPELKSTAEYVTYAIGQQAMHI